MKASSIQVLATAAVLLASGCLDEPVLDGRSLECSTAEACSEFGPTWRCIQGGCVQNEAPSILGFSDAPDGPPQLSIPITVAVGSDVTLYAFTRDTDGDAVELQWTQNERPGDTLDEPSAGQTLTITGTAQGTYSYRVIPTDGLSTGISATVNVIARDTSVTYVSRLGTDSDACGDILNPCESIQVALDRTPNAEIRIAAAAEPYEYCVGNLSCEAEDAANVSSERITGCFNAETWEALEGRPDLCRIECTPCISPDAIGVAHLLADGTELSGITLTQRPDLSTLPADVTALGAAATLTVLETTVTNGVRPIVRDSDVIAAACGPQCITVGFSAFGGMATLENVNIAAAIDGFETVNGFFGVVAQQASLTLLGNRAQGLGMTRGEISLNAAATTQAIGIVASDSALTVDGLSILGGLGVGLIGVSLAGGTNTVENTLIDLAGFGARDVRGIIAQDCPTPCGTNPTPGCDTSDACRAGGPGELTIRGVEINLSGTATGGVAPCIGFGVQMVSAARQLRVSDSIIRTGAQFTLASGIDYQSPEDASEPVVGTLTLTNNQIELDGANNDDLCLFINSQADVPAPGGFVGVRLQRAAPALVEDNFVRAGTLPMTRDEVLIDPDLVGFGVVIRGDNSANMVQLRRNEVVVGSGVGNSTGLFVDAAPSLIENNLIYGGDTARAVGMTIQGDSTDALGGTLAASISSPEVRFNTIVGGGYLGGTPVTRAVQLRTTSPSRLTSLGTFAGNLLDAGLGTGQRAVVDNQESGTTLLAVNATPADNQGQFTPGARTGFREIVVSSGNELTWRVFTDNGEVISYRPGETASELDVVAETAVGVVPTLVNIGGEERPVYTATREGALVVPSPSGIAVVDPSSGANVDSLTFSNYDADTALGSEQSVTPREVEIRAIGVNGEFRDEVLLLLDVTPNAAASGLYRMAEVFNSRFDALQAVTDESGVIRNPERLAVLRTRSKSDELYAFTRQGDDWRMNRVFSDEDEQLLDDAQRFNGQLVFTDAGESLEAVEFIEEVSDSSVTLRPIWLYATFSRMGNTESYLWSVADLEVQPPCVGATTVNCAAPVATNLCGNTLPGSVGAFLQTFIYACRDGSLRFQSFDGTTTAMQTLNDASGMPIVDVDFDVVDSDTLEGFALVPSLNRVTTFTLEIGSLPPSFTAGARRDTTADFATFEQVSPNEIAARATFDGVTGFTTPETRCAFAVDGAGLVPRDLRLANPCPSSATGPSVPADDVDGEARSDGAPDYGADEVSP
ncbi:MAG: hypothetical protein AAF654_05335 [Myxococcota bacterium]